MLIGQAKNNPRLKRKKRDWVSSSIEACCALFFICLVYKFASLGVVVLCAITALGLFKKRSFHIPFSPIGVFSILYVALATTTAFQVNLYEGAYRTLQFVLVLSSSLVVLNHFKSTDAERRVRFIRNFTWLAALIFFHAAAYHLAIGRVTSWKTLYDTKISFSLLPLLLFVQEDSVRKKLGPLGWFMLLGGIGFLVLLSGERKAYVLLTALFAFSRARFITKILLALMATFLLTGYIAQAPEGSYVRHQLKTFLQPKQTHSIEEYYVDKDLAFRSDRVRSFVNMQARQQFRENPFIGLGATGYAHWAWQKFRGMNGGLRMNVHGEINRVPVENGIIGIFVALMYFFLICLRIAQNWWKNRKSSFTSLQRAPFYFLLFVLPFLATEALNTLMLELILLFGFFINIIGKPDSRRKHPL